jgi:hypothetical protein
MEIPTGIAANAFNCWELIDRDNDLPVDDHGDGIRHFDSSADAQSWGEDTGAAEKGAGVEPREQSGPCWIVTAICGWKLDDELPMVMHHATAEEALQAALDNDMRLSASGGLICDPDCDDCKQGGDAR